MKSQQIQKKVNELLKHTSGFFAVYLDKKIPIDALTILADRLAEQLGCEQRVMRNSVQPLLSTPFTEKYAKSLFWQLCANQDVLKKGIPVGAYDKPEVEGDEEVRIEAVLSRPQGYLVKFRVLTGHFADGILFQYYSEKELNRYAFKLGYGKNYPLPGIVSALVGLHAIVHITTDDHRPIDDVIEKESVSTYNRKTVIKYRLLKAQCKPQKGNPGLRCENCPLTFNECKATMNYE